MTGPEPRKRYNLGAWKLPFNARTLIHAIFNNGLDAHLRGYINIIGADAPDYDEQFPIGSAVTYSVELTDAEADEVAAASNLRYLEEDQLHAPQRAVGRPTGTAQVPRLGTLAWMRSRYVDLRRWHGRDVPVAVLDQGTTQAVRAAMGYTLVARTVASGISLGPGQELINPAHEHGCLVAPNAVPAGGLLLDAIISGETGSAAVSTQAAAIRWAVDNGAKVINISFGASGNFDPPIQAMQDAMVYARDNGGVQIVMSAGNDADPDINASATGSRLFSNVHSSIAFDEVTDRRALFSNHHADASGCGAGEFVRSFDIYGNQVDWSGTSASAPHMAQLMARAMTGGQFTPAQVGAAFKSNTRDTGAAASEQGGGAYDLHRSLVALGAAPSVSAGVAAPTFVGSSSASQITTSWGLTAPTGTQVDDVQVVVLASAQSNHEDYGLPDGWLELANTEWYTGQERAANNSILNNMHLRVLARSYTADQPTGQVVQFLSSKWSAIWTAAFRAPGGLDPERFVPIIRTGIGTTLSTVPVSPATTNDMQVCVFMQLFESGATGGSLSLPAGFTQRALRRPTSDAKGWVLIAATQALTDGNRTPIYTSTSNTTKPEDLWGTVTFTVPAGAVPITSTATPGDAPGSPGSFLPYYLGA